MSKRGLGAGPGPRFPQHVNISTKRFYKTTLVLAALLVCLGGVVTVPRSAADETSGNKGVIMRKPAPQQAPAAKPQLPAPAEKKDRPQAVKPAPIQVQAPAATQTRPSPAPVQQAATPEHANVAVPAHWPAALNQYFGCALERPTTDDALGALAKHLNRVTLLGVEPEIEWERFDTWLKGARRNFAKGESDVRVVEGFYKNLTGWVALESQFVVQPDRTILKDLVKVVQSQAALDPNYDEARKEKIVNTIEQQNLFVPSSILFGYSVLSYRPVVLPKGYVPFESPVKPEFTDTSNRAEASYDFIEAPGPIFRIDYDTIGAARFVIEQSNDSKQYQPVQEWKSAGPGGVRGPAVLAKPFRSRYMRLAIESQKETAVLRNPRVFALKEPPAAISPLVNEAPVIDGSFKEAPWPFKAQIDGFINPDRIEFAAAQTTVRVCHTNDALYFAIYARDPRMTTMACAMTGRDSELWNEESVAIVLHPTGKPEFRFIVNPLGAQYDSRDNNDEWNGEWQVAAKTWPVGWSAEIEIPFATLGATPGKDDWELNIVRTRRNVEDERSAWVYTGDGAEKQKGLLIF